MRSPTASPQREGLLSWHKIIHSQKLRCRIPELCCKKQGYTRLRMNVHFWASLAWEKPGKFCGRRTKSFSNRFPLFRAKKPKSFLP